MPLESDSSKDEDPAPDPNDLSQNKALPSLLAEPDITKPTNQSITAMGTASVEKEAHETDTSEMATTKADAPEMNLGGDTSPRPTSPDSAQSGSSSDEDSESDFDHLLHDPRRLRPSEKSKIDAKTRRRHQPVPLRYMEGATSSRIEDHGSFLRFLCDRVAYLEHEVETIRAGSRPVGPRPIEAYPIARSPPMTLNASSPRLLSITQYGDAQWFRKTFGPSYHGIAYAIEVQLGEDNIGILSQPATKNRGDTHRDLNGDELKPQAEITQAPSSTPTNLVPQKIRIRSHSLALSLSEIDDAPFFSGRALMISPFKLFVRNEQKIRRTLDNYEIEMQNISHASSVQHEVSGNEDERVRKSIENSSGSENNSSGIPGNAFTSETDPNSQALDSKYRSNHSVSEDVDLDAVRERCEHFRLLVHLFDGPLKPIFDQYHSIKSRTASRIAFDHLWYLFELGQEVLHQGGEVQISRVFSFTGGRDIISAMEQTNDPARPPPQLNSNADRTTVKTPFSVDCYRWDFDGENYRPVSTLCQIKPYIGFRDITSLPVYPLSFNRRKKEIKEELVHRGEKFMGLTRKNEVIHRHYTGTTIETNITKAEEIDSHVIVDQRLAILEKPEWKPAESGLTRTPCDTRELFADTYEPMYMDQIRDYDDHLQWISTRKHFLESSDGPIEPDEEDKILLPNSLYGFVLRSRKWARLLVNRIDNIVYQNSFDNLVLPDGHADSIKALVQTFSKGSRAGGEMDRTEVMMDQVRGKGKGVIILLHGEPGVGKTSTAECIADYTSRPLFPITCGNIGQNAEDVEESLERIFQLAHSWGCVLLLDEADVFLQERSKDDLVRNAVVSVFLRALEYYSGILFLTTNRVGTMDLAFRSRIHLSLYYPALGKKASLKVWKLHLEMAKVQFRKSRLKLEFDKSEILEFAKEQYKRMKKETSQSWNGRQIRNAFQTAIALAEYQAQEKRHPKKIKLTVKQFETVQKTSDTFDEYLRTTQKGSQAALARSARIRVDDFKGKGHDVKGNSRKRGSRRKASGEVVSESESSSFSDSSKSETSSSDDDASSDGDARGKQKQTQQAFNSTDDSESEAEEEIKSKRSKRSKSKKKEGEDDQEVRKAEEEKEGFKKKHRSKHKEKVSSDEDSEPEAKTGKRRSRK